MGRKTADIGSNNTGWEELMGRKATDKLRQHRMGRVNGERDNWRQGRINQSINQHFIHITQYHNVQKNKAMKLRYVKGTGCKKRGDSVINTTSPL